MLARSDVVRGRAAADLVAGLSSCDGLAMDEMRVGTAAGLLMTEDDREGMLQSQEEDVSGRSQQGSFEGLEAEYHDRRVARCVEARRNLRDAA